MNVEKNQCAGDWITVETRDAKRFSVLRSNLCRMNYFQACFENDFANENFAKIDCDSECFATILKLTIYGKKSIDATKLSNELVWMLFHDALFLGIPLQLMQNCIYVGKKIITKRKSMVKAQLIKNDVVTKGSIHFLEINQPMYLLDFSIGSNNRIWLNTDFHSTGYRIYLNKEQKNDEFHRKLGQTNLPMPLKCIVNKFIPRFYFDMAIDGAEHASYWVEFVYRKVITFDGFMKQKLNDDFSD